MKIAFFGTPQFAADILTDIISFSEIELLLVVSQPDMPVGRKQELLATPVKQIALENDIEIIQPESLLKNIGFIEKLESLQLDFIVVVAYGKIIPQAILDIPEYGCINIHGSILPKYRGASPVQAAIRAGEKQTGLTTMYMSKKMDEGDILKIAKIEIDNIDTSEDIFKKFVQIGPELLMQTLKEIMAGTLRALPQDHENATYCGKIGKEDGEVFFQKQTAQEIYNIYRAYVPWPGIYTFYEGKRVVLDKVQLIDLNFEGKIGSFVKIAKNRYGVLCRNGNILEILRVKPEGKNSMDIQSFVNGNPTVCLLRFA